LDDLSDGDDDGWSPTGGTWQVESGAVEQGVGLLSLVRTPQAMV
jgi:hypothetical protein